jgi:hypothetical protein
MEETTRKTQENNIKMNLKQIGWEDVDWIPLSQDGLLQTR